MDNRWVQEGRRMAGRDFQDVKAVYPANYAGFMQNRWAQKFHTSRKGFLKGQNLAQSISLRLWCLQQSWGCVLTSVWKMLYV